MALDPVTGQTVGELEGNVIHEDTGNIAPLFAPINQSVTASTAVVAGVAGKKIRVLALTLTVLTSGQTVTFQTQTGSAAITGPLTFGANGQLIVPLNQLGLFETLVGDGLYMALGGATLVSGFLTYVLH